MSYEWIAHRYAQAMFDLSVEQSCVSQVCGDMRAFCEIYTCSTQLKAVLDNPLIPEAKRGNIVREIAKRISASDIVTNTIRLLVRRNRAQLIEPISLQLAKMFDEQQGIVRASVTSAAPLSAQLSARLQAQLESMTGKRVVMTHSVDSSLIAGIVTRLGDTVIDGSLRSRLNELRNDLLSQY